MGAARTVLIVLGAILTLLGTYLFGLFPATPPEIGSGLGFAMKLPTTIMATPSGDPITYYLFLVLFIVWLGSGVLQLVGLKSKVVGILFSLVPLAIGVMFLLLSYTPILGAMTQTFFDLTAGEVYFGFIPYYYELLGMGLGVYALLAGGALGFIGSLLSKD